MELNLKIAGGIMVALALLHAIFPRRFQWKTELTSITLLSRQVMYVHTFFIAFTVALMGLLCLTSSGLLIGTELGKRIAFGLAIFWGARLLIQFFGYSSELWRGKRLETCIHILFSAIWTYFTAIFALIVWGS